MRAITTMTLTSDYSVNSRELCIFLSAYASVLLGCGATCIRIEKNIGRIAKAFDRDAELTIMPRHIHITVFDRHSDDLFTSMSAVRGSAVDFDLNTRLSRLSWKIADRHIGFDMAQRIFFRISKPRQRNQFLVLMLVSLANASFCRLFGGDIAAMAVVFLATFAGFFMRRVLLEHKTDIRLAVICCAFISSVIGATGLLFSLGDTPEIALATSVLYLVPGIPFLNSFSDMLCRHYICAFSRFVDAVVLTCCLSIGLCAAMLLMNVGMF